MTYDTTGIGSFGRVGMLVSFIKTVELTQVSYCYDEIWFKNTNEGHKSENYNVDLQNYQEIYGNGHNLRRKQGIVKFSL